ncbi:hypothetical protein [Microcoleus sp. FACHB-672]|uniref:hypothetical protein n=1 Tax=Microcoleus sp. FACHB-672 TaxID=2692825 RepID=UPI001682ADAB|nr:hypothetical protein [Microcoleus sp. FACHB-672]MBD2040207.1 hypothetical protein [Microcoleus sp. FACHB-672]
MSFSLKKIERYCFREISSGKFGFSRRKLIPIFLLAGIVSAGTSFMLFNLVGVDKAVSQSANQRQQTFTSSSFRATLQYPSHWKLIEGYDTFNTRYGSSNGFFMMSAIQNEGITFEALCAQEASHKLKPYGSNPRIQKLQIQGQQACLILPSKDQNEAMMNQAQLIVQAPREIKISGSRYKNFVLVADKYHIRELAKTLKFI